jgi:hypothetical protein
MTLKAVRREKMPWHQWIRRYCVNSRLLEKYGAATLDSRLVELSSWFCFANEGQIRNFGR